MNRSLEETKGLLKNLKNEGKGRARLDWINDISIFINKLEQDNKELKDRIKEYGKVVIELIDNDENSNVGFDTEEIYNQAIADRQVI